MIDAEIQKQFMTDQVEEINKFKWIRSEQVGYDLGYVAVKEWITRFAKTFREYWFKNHCN
jgi:hypothetical protein